MFHGHYEMKQDHVIVSYTNIQNGQNCVIQICSLRQTHIRSNITTKLHEDTERIRFLLLLFVAMSDSYVYANDNTRLCEKNHVC